MLRHDRGRSSVRRLTIELLWLLRTLDVEGSINWRVIFIENIGGLWVKGFSARSEDPVDSRCEDRWGGWTTGEGSLN